jgi:hypothetical protein
MSAPVAATLSVLTHRDRAIQRAVAAGSAQLVAGAKSDMYLDGRACSDQFAAHRLVRAGLIAAIGPARTGQHIAARLTAVGAALLGMTVGNEKRRPGRGCHVGVRPGPGRGAGHDFPA